MWISRLDIKNFRAFQKETTINFSQRLTAISGLNGLGKSTLLAILTNVGEIKKFKTISGSLFRGEFSDVIMYDEKSDTSGNKCTVYFNDLPKNHEELDIPPKIDFTAHIQTSTKRKISYRKLRGENYYSKNIKVNKYKRYRLIPSRHFGKKTERKIKWPSYYLGLSRLSPLGEFDTAKTRNISSDIAKDIIKIHSNILSENLDEKAKLANLIVKSKHPKADISSKYYGFKSNSSGQDNTGQIIEAVLSFKILKKEMGQEYDGGILAIDELDATLHPAAQNKLVDWLLKESKELDLQIVFTTHSLTLLEHLSQMRLQENGKNNILINYLSSSSSNIGDIRIKKNPTKGYYMHNLQQNYAKSINFAHRISIYSEDETARWFLKTLISSSNNIDLQNLEFLDIHMSCEQLIQIYQVDSDRFNDAIFVLDPDQNEGNPNSCLVKEKDRLNFIPNSYKSNVLTLPGQYSIEKELWMFVNNLHDNDSLFQDSTLNDMGIINADSIKRMNELKDPANNDTIEVNEHSDTLTYKNWFKDNQLYRGKFLKFWINDHQNEVKKFMGLLTSVYKRIEKSIN